MYNNKGISYSHLSKEWKIGTGSIYHHLAKLAPYIKKNQQNTYELSTKGIEICEWLLNSKMGRATVIEINGFTRLTQQWILFAEQKIILPVIIALSFLASVLLVDNGLIQTGPIVLPITSEISLIESGLIWSLITILYIFLIYGLSNLLSRGEPFSALNAFRVYIIGTLPQILLIWMQLLFFRLAQIDLTTNLLLIMNILSQLLFLIFLTSSLFIYSGFSFERSIIIILGILYLHISVTAIFLLS